MKTGLSTMVKNGEFEAYQNSRSRARCSEPRCKLIRVIVINKYRGSNEINVMFRWFCGSL